MSSLLEVALANKLAYVYSLLADVTRDHAANQQAFDLNGVTSLIGIETAGAFPHTGEASGD